VIESGAASYTATWSGTFHPRSTGPHRFDLYLGYALSSAALDGSIHVGDVDKVGAEGDGHRSVRTAAIPLVAGQPVDVTFTLSASTGECAAPRLSMLGPLDSPDSVLQAIAAGDGLAVTPAIVTATRRR
jgi:hypothetical protein